MGGNMLSMEKILIPIDGSDSSLEALVYAGTFASEFNITVYLMTVIEPHHCIYDVYAEQITLTHRVSESTAILNQRLLETEKKARKLGIPNIILRRCFGLPCEKIIEVATKEKIDLIVMGTHARTGIAHFLIGSVTEKVIRTAPCPVLVIRPNIHGLVDNINVAARAQFNKDFKPNAAH